MGQWTGKDHHIESYRMQLQYFAQHAENWQERLETARQAVRDFPAMPEFHAEYAQCLAWQFDYPAARQEIREALRCFAEATARGDTASLGIFSARQCVYCQDQLQRWQRIVRAMSGIHITACGIMRNEEQAVTGWLSAVRSYSDAIVLVDTGSTDYTVSMARHWQQETAGAPPLTIRSCPWTDDFSAARNAALEVASGGWIAFLDADETVQSPDCVRGLLAAIETEQPEVEAVFAGIHNVDEDQGGLEIQQAVSVRLFRRHPALRYTGRVHEVLQWGDGHPLEAIMEDQRLQIRHTGYSSRRIQGKIRRNLAMLQREIAETGEQPRHAFYLANCYFVLQDYEKALYYAEKAMASPVQYIGMEKEAACWAAQSRAYLAAEAGKTHEIKKKL